MVISVKRVCVFFTFFCLAFPSCWCQKTSPKLNFVNIKEGLSKVGIYSILQDNYGFIWIGTNGSGLYRYDGMEYKSYKHVLNDTTSLSSSLIFSTFFDSKNRLWVGTEEGLNLYDRDNDRFRRILLTDNEETGSSISISSIQEDGHGNLYVGGFGSGLFRLNLESFKVEKIGEEEFNPSNPLVIQAIQIDGYGKIYVGSNRGLFELDQGSDFLERSYFKGKETIETVNASIKSLLIDGKNNIWIGTFSEGLYKIGRREVEGADFFTLDKFLLSQNTFFSLITLPDGTLMCGTENNGLFHINEDGNILNHYVSSKNDQSSILSNSIWSLYLDNDKKIWLGYYNKGVAVYDRLYDKFKDIESLYNNPLSLQVSSVTSIAKNPSGKLWIAMDGGGIDILDLKKNDYTHINKANSSAYSGLGSDYIQTIFFDSKDNVWAGSWDGGIYFLKKGSNVFINYNTSNTQGGLTSNTVMSFDEDRDGTIWIGTYHSGLHSFDPDTGLFKHFELYT